MPNTIDVGLQDRLFYPANLDNQDLNPGLIQFTYFEQSPDGSAAQRQIIQLGMPDTISSPSTVSWDNEKFGMAGDIVNKFSQQLNGTDNASSPLTLENTTDSVRQRLTQGAIYKTAAAASTQLGGNASADGIMGASSGKIPNPYLTAVFRGVDFRTFQFQFKFTPLNAADCDTIYQIYSVMRANALPNLDGGGEQPFLAYPMTCAISYYWKGEIHPWLHQFKKAACTAIDIDFAGAGYFTAMRNGFPSQITISTRWSEMELVTRDDVMQKGY